MGSISLNYLGQEHEVVIEECSFGAQNDAIRRSRSRDGKIDELEAWEYVMVACIKKAPFISEGMSVDDKVKALRNVPAHTGNILLEEVKAVTTFDDNLKKNLGSPSGVV